MSPGQSSLMHMRVSGTILTSVMHDGYSLQDDVVMGTLSVRENLHFSACTPSSFQHFRAREEAESGEGHQRTRSAELCRYQGMTYFLFYLYPPCMARYLRNLNYHGNIIQQIGAGSAKLLQVLLNTRLKCSRTCSAWP